MGSVCFNCKQEISDDVSPVHLYENQFCPECASEQGIIDDGGWFTLRSDSFLAAYLGDGAENVRKEQPRGPHTATCPVGKHCEDPGCHYLGSCNCGFENARQG